MRAEVSKDQPHRKKDPLTQKRQEMLGRALQKMYEGVLNEPVPDDLLELLDKIEEKSKEDEKSGISGDVGKQDPRGS
jgi:hypothetical protein